MTSSRFSSLSAATRQWVVEQYTPLICAHTDKNRRTGLFFDIVIDSMANGELCAIEQARAVFMPALAALDDEMLKKMTHLMNAPDDAHSGGQPEDISPQDPLRPGNSDNSAGGPTVCGPEAPIPQQRALFPLDVIEAKIQDIRVRLARVDAEHQRLLEQEHDSREVRKMLRNEKKVLKQLLDDLLKARRRAKQSPDAGMDNFDDLGIDLATLGLEIGDLEVRV
ncbi:hypothetical protein [Streptomyces sp. NPDC059819]|uniref:hypothetical protein n=1 Tax=Streptomyces sp. NPDC059819 TaxID=3346963 RepID=UPI003664EDB0